MKNLLFSLFAIGLAGVAAIAATTAMLNAPVKPRDAVSTAAHIAPPKSDKPADPNAPPTTSPAPAPSGEKPAIPRYTATIAA